MIVGRIGSVIAAIDVERTSMGGGCIGGCIGECAEEDREEEEDRVNDGGTMRSSTCELGSFGELSFIC